MWYSVRSRSGSCGPRGHVPFDKTGIIAAETLVFEGVVGGECVSLLQVIIDRIGFFIARKIERSLLVLLEKTKKDTTLGLVATDVLIQLDDGTIVRDLVGKTTLEVLEWNLRIGCAVPC
jgi:hypothetical protein